MAKLKALAIIAGAPGLLWMATHFGQPFVPWVWWTLIPAGFVVLAADILEKVYAPR